jgi:hypothetical protein
MMRAGEPEKGIRVLTECMAGMSFVAEFYLPSLGFCVGLGSVVRPLSRCMHVSSFKSQKLNSQQSDSTPGATSRMRIHESRGPWQRGETIVCFALSLEDVSPKWLSLIELSKDACSG